MCTKTISDVSGIMLTYYTASRIMVLNRNNYINPILFLLVAPAVDQSQVRLQQPCLETPQQWRHLANAFYHKASNCRWHHRDLVARHYFSQMLNNHLQHGTTVAVYGTDHLLIYDIY